MKTLASLLFDRCGLSHREAAEFLKVRLDTVKSWSSGRNSAPAGAIDDLRRLYARIEKAAEEGLTSINHAPPGVEIELGLASDDYEAQQIGWPCVGAHAAVLGIVAARTNKPLIILPRGSTLATAAAIEAHEK
jgi:hypothetical protein